MKRRPKLTRIREMMIGSMRRKNWDFGMRKEWLGDAEVNTSLRYKKGFPTAAGQPTFT
jgi:hypothetical protein